MKKRSSMATIRLRFDASDPRLDRWQGEIESLRMAMDSWTETFTRLSERVDQLTQVVSDQVGRVDRRLEELMQDHGGRMVNISTQLDRISDKVLDLELRIQPKKRG